MRGSPARQDSGRLEPIGEHISDPLLQAPRKHLSRLPPLVRGVTGIIGELAERGIVRPRRERCRLEAPAHRDTRFSQTGLVLDTFAVVVEGKPDLLQQFTGNTTTKLRLCQCLYLW